MTEDFLPPGIVGLLDDIKSIPAVNQIILYGSRARGDAAQRSDYDLAIDAPDLSEQDWDKIYWMVEDAETLYKIDCVWLQKSGSSLRANILRDAKVLFQR